MDTIKITIQKTNDSTILKFVSNAILGNYGSYEFNNIDEAKHSPLAQQLFYLPFVKKIFITANFIAIQRYDIVQWDDVQKEVCQKIEDYLQQGNSIIKQENFSRKIAIEVYAESTPNPSVMKFATNKPLTTIGVEFKNIEQAKSSSPLAMALFNFPFVKEVFISENYVSITKDKGIQWDEIYLEIRNFIRTYLQEQTVIIKKVPKQKVKQQSKKSNQNVSGISVKIIDIIDQYIKPVVASDGGNIAFQSYDENNKIVSVILQGACSGCPSSTMTLKNGIETMLKEMLPNKINEVVAING